MVIRSDYLDILVPGFGVYKAAVSLGLASLSFHLNLDVLLIIIAQGRNCFCNIVYIYDTLNSRGINVCAPYTVIYI